ncbi:MAG: 1-acyl-sn-glycerol-3-phosphate acyltransferase [Thermanaerothrix sp.]|nr:1-acyl-sn-glycerol-3-phosphate acyltransferase [Thermanaerothrix sp.]
MEHSLQRSAQPAMSREQLQALLRFLYKHLTRTEFVGLEHLPREGGVLVVTNHISRLDVPLLFINPVRPDITALVADKYLRYPLFRFMVEVAGAIWIDRSKADFTALKLAVEVLRQGRALGIAPEGTRSSSGKLLEGKAGTVLIAQKANVPIVPVGLAGTEKALKSLLTLRRGKITARFGPAFRLPPLDPSNRQEDLRRQTDEIMCRIAVLLPESYRGYYANHPRVKELEAEGNPPPPQEIVRL